MHSIYTSGEYLQQNPSWHAEDSAWKAAQILRAMERYRFVGETICEVGCGAGEILNQLHQLLPSHCRFTGFEISPQAFGLCSQKQRDRLEFLNVDILSTTKKYDVLLAMDVLEHVPDYMGFLEALREKATHKIFHIPLELTVRGILGGRALLGSRRALGHLHYFDRGTAIATLQDCGYSIVGDFYTFFAGELPHRIPKSRCLQLAMRCLKAWNEHFAVRLLGGHGLLVVAR